MTPHPRRGLDTLPPEALTEAFTLEDIHFFKPRRRDPRRRPINKPRPRSLHRQDSRERKKLERERRMAGVGDDVNGESESHDLGSLLSGAGERDFLVRSGGDQVNISNLDGKIVGLYFSGSWCGPCRQFTPKLIEVYDEIVLKGNAFEVIFVSSDRDEESFSEYFSKMPWLAIPFSDADTRSHLKKLFKVRGIPHLVVLDGNGKVLTHEADEIVMEHGSEGYPFSVEKINELKEREETAKREQTLQSVLSSPSCDYVISNSGNKVPIPKLEGKIVGLYFFIASFGSCQEFTPRLVEMYGKLKEKGENFEVILIPLGEDKSAFEERFASMPWLAVPFKDKRCEKLARYFEIRAIPTLVVLGSDGKTLKMNVAEVVEVHGVEAFPFSPEKFKELEEKDQAKLDSQTLESLLVSGEQNFVIGKDGITVPVSELVGKNILLYFSAHWCGPCRAFMPKLIEAYHSIKDKDSAFEVVFVSSDRDQNSFDDFFAGMPWLALPFGDERKNSLSRTFKIRGIPSLVAIGPTGRTVTKGARNLLMIHGADAYPFTEERIKELDAQLENEAKGWPEKVKHELHQEHELVLTRRNSYGCDKCGELGYVWSYLCAKCDFDLHPKCALEGKGKDGEEAEEEEGQTATEEGYVCDGDVCRKA